MSDQVFAPESGVFPLEEDSFDTLMQTAIPIPDRMTIVPSWYMKHKEPTKTVVTQGGKRIEPGFVVAQVAPELRWAIQGNGEVLGQLEFERAHERWYIAQYQFAGQPPDDPNLRSIPSAEKFVSRCVDPNDSSRLQPITVQPKQAPPPLQPIYNANGDMIEEAGEVDRPAGMDLKAPEKVEAPVTLEAALDLPDASPEEQRRASIIAQGKDPDFKAPCGKPYPAGSKYLHLHTRHCKEVECDTGA